MTWTVHSEYGTVSPPDGADPLVIVKSWADTYIAAWWYKPGQGRVFANVPAAEVWLRPPKAKRP